MGLHARAAMKLVNLASRFSSDIIIKFNDKTVNAKSIMNVLVLGATYGSDIELTVSGDDEEKALEAVSDLINNRFGEAQ